MSSRHVYVAALAAIAVAVAFLALVAITQPAEAHAQRHNAYWPYSVETVIRDR